MLGAASYVQFVEFFAQRTFIDSAPADPVNHHTVSTRVLPAKDGWLAVAPVSGQAIRRTCEAVGHPEWVDELRSARGQFEVQSGLFDRLETVLPTETVDHWLKVLADVDVPAALCLTMDAHLADPQVVAQEIYRTTTWEGIGQVRTVRYPAEFGSAGRIGCMEAPHEVGQDNHDLLA
jgi:crotonobetainyl-CoA:carnitine CoA-transferase CaiB-like acyl-CoA transferase